MIICPSCYTRNEENALFCAECGKGLNLPDCARHEFTHGVMRYIPEGTDEKEETPLYLTREAAEMFRQDTPDAAPRRGPVPADIPAAGVPAPAPGPAASVKKKKASVPKPARKSNGRLAAIILMSVIGILVILIIFGIVFLLGG